MVSVALVGLVLSSGCSMLNFEGSKQDYVKRVAVQRAAVSGDQNMMKMVASGNTIAAGVDLADPSFWDVLAEHPVRAVVAAAADLAAAAAATWTISSSIDKSHHDSNSLTVNGNGNTTSLNNGTGNTVNNNPSSDSHNSP